MIFKPFSPNIRLSSGHNLEPRASMLSWQDQMAAERIVEPLCHRPDMPGLRCPSQEGGSDSVCLGYDHSGCMFF